MVVGTEWVRVGGRRRRVGSDRGGRRGGADRGGECVASAVPIDVGGEGSRRRRRARATWGPSDGERRTGEEKGRPRGNGAAPYEAEPKLRARK